MLNMPSFGFRRKFTLINMKTGNSRGEAAKRVESASFIFDNPTQNELYGAKEGDVELPTLRGGSAPASGSERSDKNEHDVIGNDREESDVVVEGGQGGGTLPSGWTEVWTEDHLEVYYVSPNGVSQWERPNASLQAVPIVSFLDLHDFGWEYKQNRSKKYSQRRKLQLVRGVAREK